MSNIMKAMLTSILIIIAIGVAVLIVVLNMNQEKTSGAQTIDDIVRYSYETPEITTDLEDGSYVKVQFQVVTDSKKAREEIEKRDFQIKNILIKELAVMTEEDFKSRLTELEATVKDKLNEIMTEGEIIDVYTIDKILQ